MGSYFPSPKKKIFKRLVSSTTHFNHAPPVPVTMDISQAPAASTAVARKSTDTQLMAPPSRPKRIKRPKNVLDEDTYTEALSQITARDFFPGLLESETQQEYLDALESRDEAWISSAGRRL